MDMDALGAETFELALDIASGQRSKGELAGHAQVSVWRDWPRTGSEGLEAVRRRPVPNGRPLTVRDAPPIDFAFNAVVTGEGVASDQVALVMPTSLCSGQVARLIAEDLDAHPPPWSDVSRFVALVHTEGCGSNNAAGLFLDTLAGHLAHRSVRHAVLLEHGCEQTHNDAGAPPPRSAWPRGGPVRVGERASSTAESRACRQRWPGSSRRWRQPVRRRLGGGTSTDAGPYRAAAGARNADGTNCAEREPGSANIAPQDTVSDSRHARRRVGAVEARIALVANGPLPDAMGEVFGRLAAGFVAAGATVVVPDNGGLVHSDGFRNAVFPDGFVPDASLAFGRPADEAGFHIMEAPTGNPVETFAGLGATGVDLMLCHIGRNPLQGHPMLPLVQVTADPAVAERYGVDVDRVLVLDGSVDVLAGELASLVAEVASCRYRPKLWSRGVTEFQLTRGRLGLSM